jgi:hypothetical protein
MNDAATSVRHVRGLYTWRKSRRRTALYRVIKTSLCTWWLQHISFLPHCLAADRQGQGDTGLILTPSVIPNSNYVVMVSDWNCLKHFCMFFCTLIIRCTEIFWSSCVFQVCVMC